MKQKTIVIGIVDICMAVKTCVTEEEKIMQEFTRDKVHGMIPELVTNEKQPQFKM
jgi:hypothetical protein